MAKKHLRPGDEVALSSGFIRSVGNHLHFGINRKRGTGGGGLTAERLNRFGVVVGFAPDWPDLAFVRWEYDPGAAYAVNVANLIPRSRVHLDAMADEHKESCSHKGE